MPGPVLAPEELAALRVRASRRLSPGLRVHSRATGSGSGSEALAVLHALASSPDTANDALALLHELQVYQVELELQAEELRESRAELESALQQQIELYDKQPVGCLSLDPHGAMTELNLAGAALLGLDRAQALGQCFDNFLSADSVRALHDWRSAVGTQQTSAALTLQLATSHGSGRALTAQLRNDPAAQRCLVVLVGLVVPAPGDGNGAASAVAAAARS